MRLSGDKVRLNGDNMAISGDNCLPSGDNGKWQVRVGCFMMKIMWKMENR
ncbi:hypothetical protein QT711_13075 [Sporosarcina saromensis]|uniref:Uncharacterized protein n=1 Tax=Sporosarcina saromensis TaxID=359365 RepID=A0ABU4GB02_9BACL|nr:hypothetical protein [Sporosarcina saromensis]